MRRKTIVHLVDNVDYVKGNCFQHQLFESLRGVASSCEVDLYTVDLYSFMTAGGPWSQFDSVISTLKLRTLFRQAEYIAHRLTSRKVVVYDQDPWESFRDGSQFNGAYTHISKHVNVASFAVTTREWSELINSKGIPCEFVKMWVLPRYCSANPVIENRKIHTGFMGAQHPYRKALFDHMSKIGQPITIVPGGAGYDGYLRTLSTMQCYVHNEDSSFLVDGKEMNLSHGLWIKDIEAAARGCYSIRNRGTDLDSYVSDDIKTVKVFDSFDEVAQIVESIADMDNDARQFEIDSTVKHIKNADHWRTTARRLIELAAA